MSSLGPLGFGVPRLRRPSEEAHEFVVLQRALNRVLNFTGLSIDEVVNSDVAKRMVLGYYKLHKQVQRGCEVVDLERSWNRRVG